MCDIMEKLREEGRAEGKEHVNKLNAILIKAKRFDDLERTIYDADYQTQLMIELLPNETKDL